MFVQINSAIIIYNYTHLLYEGSDLLNNVIFKKVNSSKLEEFAAAALKKAGVPDSDAELTARILLDADLRGIDSHGVFNLYGYYVKGIQSGRINSHPDIKITAGSPTTASVDGDNGLGFVTAHKAMTETIKMAKANGTAWATVFNSNHFGAGGYYALMAAKEDMIGMVFSTGGSTVAGPGGKNRLVGNNVISVAAPGDKYGPFVLDMAPTMAIANKLHMLEWAGKPVPEGWTVDSDGKFITDPKVYFEEKGAVLPLGSTIANGVYKGFGLLLVSDIMTGLLSGDGGSMFRKKGEDSHAFCAIRIDAFPAGGDFKSLMDAMIEKIHEQPTTADLDGMKYPGERENETYKIRITEGIPLRENVVNSLEEMAQSLDIPINQIYI